MTTGNDAIGTGAAGTTASLVPATIFADSTLDVARVRYLAAVTTANQAVTGMFRYKVI
jgi:hypothetical protein